MTRVLSTIILTVVLVGLILEHIDARKVQPSYRNNRKQIVKSRSKRQYNPFARASRNDARCNYALSKPCQQSNTYLKQSGSILQNALTNLENKFYVNGPVTLSALQNGGMCSRDSNLFTANAFSALDLGHITLPQLASLNLLPVQSVDSDGLARSRYTNNYGSNNLLSPLGVQANLFGHVDPSQLQQLGLYPLQNDGVTADTLNQAGYITDDCVPTALGLSAMQIRYLPSNNFGAYGCPSGDSSQVTLPQLQKAKYVYGDSNLLTPVGLAALHTGYYNEDTFQKLNIFPFNANNQRQLRDNTYQFNNDNQVRTNNYNNYQPQYQDQRTNTINDLVNVGYLQPKTNLLTNAAYYGLMKKYFTTDNFQNLDLWPCNKKLSLKSFILAGYATYSGHLTPLGTSLVHAQYISYELLQTIGIHLNDDYHIFHQALVYGGYHQSDYRTMQNTLMNTNTNTKNNLNIDNSVNMNTYSNPRINTYNNPNIYNNNNPDIYNNNNPDIYNNNNPNMDTKLVAKVNTDVITDTKTEIVTDTNTDDLYLPEQNSPEVQYDTSGQNQREAVFFATESTVVVSPSALM